MGVGWLSSLSAPKASGGLCDTLFSLISPLAFFTETGPTIPLGYHIHCGFPLKCNTNWQAVAEGRMRITG